MTPDNLWDFLLIIYFSFFSFSFWLSICKVFKRKCSPSSVIHFLRRGLAVHPGARRRKSVDVSCCGRASTVSTVRINAYLASKVPMKSIHQFLCFYKSNRINKIRLFGLTFFFFFKQKTFNVKVETGFAIQ